MGDGQGDRSGREVASAEVDSFLRAVARVPREAPEPSLVGRTLLHFHVVQRLGAGGMGVVYRAVDEKLRRPVAIKVLSARLLADERHRETLLREARSAAAVNHPNIASIYEVHDGPEGAFFVMELVEGETLRSRLSRAGAIPVTEALRIGLDIARGLARAHASNVVHRDLKCENVMLTPDGHVKLLDFGLATVQGVEEGPTGGGTSSSGEAAAMAPTMPATPTPTTGGRVAGTPSSMAPEQARGEPADARADVYGFGVVLYEMLTGKHAFPHRTGRPWEWGDDEKSPAWTPERPLRDVAPKVSREIDRLVARCLSYDRDARPADGAALVRDVTTCTAQRPRRWPWAAVGGAMVLAATAVWVPSRKATQAERPARAPSAATSPELTKPVLRRVAYDEGLGLGSVSSDGTRVVYTASGEPRPKSFRVRTLATRTDEWFTVPGGADLVVAQFVGEGSAERLLVITSPERALWSIRPDTKEATLVSSSGVVGGTCCMSADGGLLLWLRYDRDRKVGTYVLQDMATGIARDLGEPPGQGLVELSPDGSLLAWIDHGGDAPRLLVARAETLSKPKVIALDRPLDLALNVAWIDEERLAVVTDARNEGGLWMVRIDPSALERRGSVEPIAQWSGYQAVIAKVHRALRAITFTAMERHYHVAVASLQPTTRRVLNVRPLTRSESEDYAEAWRGDSRTLVFSSDRSGLRQIYAKNVDDDSPERVLASGPTGSRSPQLVPGQNALLYWTLPDGGPPSLVRAPFDGNALGPPTPLFDAPEFGQELSLHMRMRCPAAGSSCILLSYPSIPEVAWYRIDPRNGARVRIDGLPLQAHGLFGTSHWDVSPDGTEIAVAGKNTVDVFGIGGPTRKLRSVPVKIYETDNQDDLDAALWTLAYDADGKGIFLGNGEGRIDYLSPSGVQTNVREGVIEDFDADFTVSPDGKRAAFSEAHRNYPIWMVRDAFAASP